MFRLSKITSPQTAGSLRALYPVAGRYQPSISVITSSNRRYAAGSDDSRKSGGEKETHYHREHEAHSDTSEPDSFSEEFDRRIPSNRARPTLSDAYQHSGADKQHPRRPSKEEMSAEDAREAEQSEEDVKRHNEDIERRYDRAFSQVIDDKGNVGVLDKEVGKDGKVKGG